MPAAKVQASLRIRAVSSEPPLLTHTSSESRGTFRQKARSLAPLNGWACAVTICHDGMLEDTNSLDGAQTIFLECACPKCYGNGYPRIIKTWVPGYKISTCPSPSNEVLVLCLRHNIRKETPLLSLLIRDPFTAG